MPRAEIPPRILVVDDEPLVRWSLATGLHLAGFETAAAADSTEALAEASRSPHPDLVLLDVRLWGPEPQALLEQLRAAAPGCRILLLAVTGQEFAVPTGPCIDVIRKPFDLPEVVERVVAVMRCPGHGAEGSREKGASHASTSHNSLPS